MVPGSKPRTVTDNGAGPLPEIDGIENVCIFVADALRWDYLPEAIASQGTLFRTIAASLTTHTSLPSLITGLYPHRHGVRSWKHRIGDLPSLLNFDGYDCGFYHPGPQSVINDGTFSILEENERRRITDLESPWLYVERHHGCHAPYNAIEQWEDDWEAFVNEFGGRTRKLRRTYRQAAQATAEDFANRVQTIEERGEVEETLIIFCSDHGEYLGEAGLVDHNAPIRPEGIYVPTVFVHPSIENGRRAPGVARHIDLFPTALGYLDEPTPEPIDGMDLRNHRPETGFCTARMHSSIYGRNVKTYEGYSIWDADGGHVLNATGLLGRLVYVVGLLGGSGWSPRHLRRNPSDIPTAALEYLSGQRSFGDPAFSLERAREMTEEILARDPVTAERIESLGDETEQHLQELGYL